MTTQRIQTKLALGALLVPLFFVIGFSLSIIGTYHKPHPNGITIGVVAPPQVQARLALAAPPAFVIRPAATVAEAARAVRERELKAAFVPSPDPRRPATVIVASAGGRLTAAAAEQFLRSVTTAQGGRLTVRDVRPLAPGDPIGIGVFMFMIISTIGGYLAVTVLATIAPTLEPRRRYAMIAGVAVLVPTIAYLIGGLAYGTYTGSFGTILAFIGVGALYTFVIGLVTRLLQVLLGPPALFVSLAIFVFLNIPSLGATYTDTMLGGLWRFLNQFWLGAETVNAERSILYFGGQDVGTDLLRLLAWTAVVVALLSLPVARKLGRPVLTRALRTA
ncbi:hypothetical protein [Solirubrobacter soli]|uniref:hypothetical protein n=1 Tax=Solirubrobacter soli TaxID=363832 RepID=UPI0004144EF9|nr:hypothetical protein [Solirubrobacter soli]